MRSDAARNARAILRAARDAVADEGIGASMASIAARADVAVGTLYRHYPDKERLIAAVVEDATRRMVERITAAERRVDDGADVGAELDALVRELAEVHAADRPFKHGEMLDPDTLSRSDDPLVAEGWQALGRLVAQAQREGAVRTDVGLADLVVLVTSVPDDPERRRAYVAVVLDGLRPPRR